MSLLAISNPSAPRRLSLCRPVAQRECSIHLHRHPDPLAFLERPIARVTFDIRTSISSANRGIRDRRLNVARHSDKGSNGD